jgi:flagellar hook protein FlgE
MGLASALTTALTGLTAAETTIDVVGNNLANSQTVGFKASEAVFATQFLQTQGLGSAPSSGSGGTNPRQTGLGTQVAEITPDFSQGTIEISSNPSDLAIQGDGFFVVQGTSGEALYTRNGIFKTNSNNELVTITGNRLLGHGVDENFQIQSTTLVPLSIPLGASAVAYRFPASLPVPNTQLVGKPGRGIKASCFPFGSKT